jgi:hypothetical protein
MFKYQTILADGRIRNEWYQNPPLQSDREFRQEFMGEFAEPALPLPPPVRNIQQHIDHSMTGPVFWDTEAHGRRQQYMIMDEGADFCVSMCVSIKPKPQRVDWQHEGF